MNAGKTFLSMAIMILIVANVVARTTVESLRTEELQSRLTRLSPTELDDVLWLGRCIFSESNRLHEQELIAWIVRNRVETKYRGETYREVILEARQFSVFDRPTSRRTLILSLNEQSESTDWQETLGIALDVYEADASARPFPVTTRHFYSPKSMKGRTAPKWAENATPLSSDRLGVDPDRFLFFDDVDGARLSIEDIPSHADRLTALQLGGSEVLRSRLSSYQPSGKVRRSSRPSVLRLHVQ